MRPSVTCLAFALLSLPVVAADPPPRPVKDIERDIEATTKKLAELRAELLASQRAQKPKPKPDLTLLPPTGGHVHYSPRMERQQACQARLVSAVHESR